MVHIFFYAISATAYCQIDSTEIDDDKDTTTQMVQINKILARKRGVYKTYEEYLSDSPSVDAQFTLTPMQISKKSTLIAEADVDYKGKRPKKIWGVCDGEYVYIRVMVGQFFKNHYFRLQCDGPFAIYIFSGKHCNNAYRLRFGSYGLSSGRLCCPTSVCNT